MAVSCFKCQTPLPLSAGAPVSRKEDCPKCSADLHCCRMCHFYDINSHNECREPNAEKVSDKDRANFCDYFQLASRGKNSYDTQSLMDAAKALFKDD